MAYVSGNPLDEEQKQGVAPLPTLTPESGTINPQAQVGSVKNADVKGGAPTADASRYLEANQAAGNRLAGRISQDVAQSAENAGQAMTGAQNEFNASAQPFTYDPNLLNQIAQNPLGVFNWSVPGSPPPPPPENGNQNAPGHGHHPQQPPPPNAPYNPGTLDVANQGQYDFIQGLKNASYEGPTSIEGQESWQNALGQEANAAQKASGLTNQQGQLDALRSLYSGGSGNWGGNVSALDAGLLQGAGAQKSLQAASHFNDPFVSQAQNISSQAQATGQANQQSAANAQGAVNNAFFGANGWYPNFQQDLQNRLATAQSQNPNGNQHKPHTSTLTAADVATPEDYAKLQALNQLMGTQYTI